jgi:hypothetical protein
MAAFRVADSLSRVAESDSGEAVGLSPVGQRATPAADSPSRRDEPDSREADGHSRGADNENVVVQNRAIGMGIRE